MLAKHSPPYEVLVRFDVGTESAFGSVRGALEARITAFVATVGAGQRRA